MRRRTATGYVLGAVVVATVIAACTSGSKSASSGIANGSGAGGGAAAVGPVGAPAPADSASVPTVKAAGGGTGFDAARLALGGPSVIRTADLTVSAANVGTQADRARGITTDLGGSVDGDDRTSGAHATATLTLRLPPTSLGDALSRLAMLGKEQSRHLSSRDVTTEVADVDSRVRSATSAIAQLRSLYDKATRVSDIIAIESELNQRETDLESLQAQQRALAGQVTMATVTLYLVTTEPVAHHASHGGIAGGFTNGWHAFTRAAVALVTGIGAALPFLVLLAVVGAAWLAVRRRRVGGVDPLPAAPPAPEPSS